MGSFGMASEEELLLTKKLFWGIFDSLTHKVQERARRAEDDDDDDDNLVCAHGRRPVFLKCFHSCLLASLPVRGFNLAVNITERIQ